MTGPCTDSIEYNSYDLYLSNYTSPDSPVKSTDELLAAMQSDPEEYPSVTDFMESIVDGATISCPTKLDYTCTIYQEIRTELARFNEFALARYDVDVLMFPPVRQPPAPHLRMHSHSLNSLTLAHTHSHPHPHSLSLSPSHTDSPTLSTLMLGYAHTRTHTLTPTHTIMLFHIPLALCVKALFSLCHVLIACNECWIGD